MMYEYLLLSPKEVFMAYIVFFSACLLASQLAMFVIKAVSRGVSRWK